MTEPDSRKQLGLLAICLATFMLLLDITIVQVALPAIQRDLGGSLTGLQWVVDAYALPLAALVVSLGTLADRYGRRLLFMAGVVVFTLSSLLCGLAPNLTMLSVARAVQGIGGAAMFATALALIGQEYSGPARGRAIAAWGSTVGLAVAIGPLAGGILIRLASWPWIFYVNLPIGVLTVVLTRQHVTEGREPNPRRLDVPGLVALSGALLLAVEGLLRGSSESWSDVWVRTAFVGAAVLLVAFILLLRRPDAVIDPALFRSRSFTGVSVATFALGMGMFAMFLFLTIYLQNVLRYTPLQGGLRMLVTTIPVFLVPLMLRSMGVNVVSGRLVSSGLTLIAVGLMLMTLAGSTTSWLRIAPGLFVAGIGIGLANPAVAATALAVVPPTRSGLASGVSNTCRITGLATGIAVLGAVFQSRIDSALPPGSHEIGRLIAAGRLSAAASHSTAAAVERAFDSGFHTILVVAAVIVAVGAVAAAVLVRIPSAPTAARSPTPRSDTSPAVPHRLDPSTSTADAPSP